MQIEKLFNLIYQYKDLIIYLFEHRDKIIYRYECESFISLDRIENLEKFELIEIIGDKIFLDTRVITFLETYLQLDDNIEISKIAELINYIKHNIEKAIEFRQKQSQIIPKIRKELKKVNFTMEQNLIKLRLHIDKVYKNIDDFSLKIKELNYYKDKLIQFKLAMDEFENFLFLFGSKLHSFYDEDLNYILESIKLNQDGFLISLITLTDDVIKYINKAQKQSIFCAKIAKLQELNENLEIKQFTNIENILEQFDMQETTIKIATLLDSEIISQENFNFWIKKLSSKTVLKIKQADKIDFNEEREKINFIDINFIQNQFRFSNLSLLDFLIDYKILKDKSSDEIGKIYCQMLLLYENEYEIRKEMSHYDNKRFRNIYAKTR
jgi:hypothetical protein